MIRSRLALRQKSYWFPIALSMVLAQSDVLSQSNDVGKPPEFEVSSVRPADPRGTGGIGLYTYPGGRIVASQCTVVILLMEALKIQAFQIIGGPRWIKDARFDIEAKPPVSSASSQSNPSSFKSPPNEEQRQMLQALLLDRFELRFHRVASLGRVYLLERTDKHLKLQPPKDKNAFSWAGAPEGGAVGHGTGLAGKNISMPQLAARLSDVVGCPVLDRTGLPGTFDFEYSTGDNDREVDATATVISSLRYLGLRLKAARGPVEGIVIDHVEKPSAN